MARLESALAGAGPESGGRLARLQRQGVVAPARGRAPAELVAERPPRLLKGEGGVAALIDERRGGR